MLIGAQINITFFLLSCCPLLLGTLFPPYLPLRLPPPPLPSPTGTAVARGIRGHAGAHHGAGPPVHGRLPARPRGGLRRAAGRGGLVLCGWGGGED